MDAAVPVLFIVGLEGGEDSELDLAGVTVLLHRPNDLDGDVFVTLLVSGLHDLAESSLAEEFDHLIYQER